MVVNVKVIYKDSLRRFAISDNSWSELESRIRTLFSIPPKTEISLSYIDEDNDVITLSTDMEFREVLSWRTEGAIKFNLTTIETNDNVPTGQFTSSQQVGNEDHGKTDSINVGSRCHLEREVSVAQSENVPSSEVSTVVDYSENTVNLESTQMQVDGSSFIDASTKQQSSALDNGENTICEDDDLYVSQTSETSAQQQNDNRPCYLEHMDRFNKLVEQSRDVLVKHPQILETVNQIMEEIIHTVPVNTENFSQWIDSFKPQASMNSRLSSSATTNTYSSQNGKQDIASSESTLFLNSPSSDLNLPPIRSVTDFASTGFSPFTVQRNPSESLHPISNPRVEVSSTSMFSASTFGSQSISSTNVQTGSDGSGRSFVDISTPGYFPFSNNPFGPSETQNNALCRFNFNPAVPQNGTRTTSETTTNISSTNPFTPNFFCSQSSIRSHTSDNSLGTPNFGVGNTSVPNNRNPGTTPTGTDNDRSLNEKKDELISMGFLDEEENLSLLREYNGDMISVIDRLLASM